MCLLERTVEYQGYSISTPFPRSFLSGEEERDPRERLLESPLFAFVTANGRSFSLNPRIRNVTNQLDRAHK